MNRTLSSVRRVLLRSLLCPGLLATGLDLGAQSTASRKLNTPSQVTIGEVDEFRLSPDGQWVAYVAQELTPPFAQELWAVPRDGSGPSVSLSGELVSGGDFLQFYFTPDSSRVVYHADQLVDNRFEVFSAPVDGSAPAVRLNGPLVAGGDVDWELVPNPMTSDSKTLIYRADQNVDGVRTLFSVPLDGSEEPRRLVAPVSSGVLSFELAPDDQTVVFFEERLFGQTEIFSVRLSSRHEPVRMNAPFSFSQNEVKSYALSADGARVVYRAEAGANGDIRLFSVPLDASAPAMMINGPLPADRVVTSFQISPTSDYVLYRADALVSGRFDLYSRPIDGSGTAQRLSQDFSSGSVTGRVAPGGRQVVYELSNGPDRGLWTIPIDSSAPRIQLGATSQALSWQFTPDGAFVVGEDFDLTVWPVDGAFPPTILADDPISVQSFRITADSSQVVFARDCSPTLPCSLYSVPLDGSQAPSEVSAGPISDSITIGLDFAVDVVSNQVVYTTNRSGTAELYAAPVDASEAPRVLNGDLPFVEAPSMDVQGANVSPDGRWVTYVDQVGMHCASLEGLPPAARLLTPAWAASPDFPEGVHFPEVQFSADSEFVFFCTNQFGNVHLFRARCDGSEPGIGLFSSFVAFPNPAVTFPRLFNFRLTSDGQRLLFCQNGLVTFGPPNTFGRVRIVPVDCSSPPVPLGSPGAPVLEGELTSDDARFVYAVQETSDYYGNQIPRGVRSDSTSGGGSAFLSPATHSYVGGLALDPTGTYALYVAEDNATNEQGLYAAPVDGSVAQMPLGSPGSTTGPRFAVHPSEARVAFTETTASGTLLRIAPLDGSGATISLAALDSAGSLQGLSYSPDGSRVVFVADLDTTGQFEVYSTPIVGGQPPVKLNQALPSFADVSFDAPDPADPTVFGAHVRVSPDGSRVIYRVDASVDGTHELWSAPIDGSAAPLQVSQPAPTPGDAAERFEFLGDSSAFVFRSRRGATRTPLFEGKTLQTGPFRRRSGPAAHSFVVQEDFLLTPRDRFVVYRADEENPGTTDLYAHPVRAPVGRVPVD